VTAAGASRADRPAASRRGAFLVFNRRTFHELMRCNTPCLLAR